MATVANVNELGAYAHNPRGNLWYNDESSFGKKMLLKMGWRNGKGLGKKEDGIKENLKVKIRNTNSGLGYKDDSYKNVMKTEYESILKSLRSEYPQQKSITNCNKNVGHEKGDLKQGSRIVKRRIRYPKLYSAKDVSRYSEKDMKSIFICSLPFKDDKEESPNSGLGLKKDSKDSESYMKEESENDLSKSQETYTSQLSVSDYFNMKMKEKKGKEQEKKYTNGIKQEEVDSCCSRINYETEEAKSDFLSNKTYKGKEQKKKYINGIKQEEIDSCCNETNYEIEETKSDFQNNKTYKGDEQKKIYTSEIKQEETDSRYNNTNYEIEEAMSDFLKNKTFKGKEKKYNSECSKALCKLEEEKKDFHHDTMTEDITRSPSRKKHKKKQKNSEINGNDEYCKNVLSLMGKEWEEAANPKKKRKKLTKDSGTFSEEKIQEKSNLSVVDELSISDKKRKRCKKESLNSTDTVESSSAQNIEVIPYKKKKKSHTNDNISASAVELLSVTSLKEEVSTNSQIENNVCAGHLTETTSETLTNIDSDRSVKKQKKLKNKFKSIRKLKSCLKSKKKNYAVKNVSFNENISYKFIESEIESTSSVSDSEDENSEDFEITSSNNNSELERDSGDIKTAMEDCNLEQQNETNCTNVSEIVSEKKMEKYNSLSGLPSSNSPHYNSWVESQQQALKMKLYKGLLKGITKHDVLKTSNLSFIKGYGNWGF